MGVIADSTTNTLKQLRYRQEKWPNDLDTQFFKPQRFAAPRPADT
ncbi:hypothetical protein [Streptomyces sp. NPDC021212]